DLVINCRSRRIQHRESCLARTERILAVFPVEREINFRETTDLIYHGTRYDHGAPRDEIRWHRIISTRDIEAMTIQRSQRELSPAREPDSIARRILEDRPANQTCIRCILDC